jgi:lipopolysaccharide transport system ATP-binding protein
MPTVISAERLSKAYLIGEAEEIPDSFMGALGQLIRSPWRNFQKLRKLDTSSDKSLTYDESREPVDSIHWALKNVSFEVEQGDVLGVIGRNGAGKSTLLKVLSRITEPTSGRAVIRGRVSSLLEVGTGFHPELSGRENVYLNGTILGMTKGEIDKKFDQIVEFSGIAKFLDTPIKRYSSGMKVRLAFAVAAHLEPEVLIIDEVLAVGDLEFQKRCIGKMQEVAGGGRTVIFVSHDFPSVQSLCTKALIIEQGKASEIMSPDEAIQQFSKSFAGQSIGAVDLSSLTIDRNHPHITKLEMLQNDEIAGGPFFIGDRLKIRVEFAGPYPFNPVIEIVVKTTSGARLFTVSNLWCGCENEARQDVEGGMECDFGAVPLMPGSYILQVALRNEYRVLHSIHEAFRLEISPSDFLGTGRLPWPEYGSIIYRGTFRHFQKGQNWDG